MLDALALYTLCWRFDNVHFLGQICIKSSQEVWLNTLLFCSRVNFYLRVVRNVINDFIETTMPDVAISINASIFYNGQNLPTIFLHESDRKMLLWTMWYIMYIVMSGYLNLSDQFGGAIFVVFKEWFCFSYIFSFRFKY